MGERRTPSGAAARRTHLAEQLACLLGQLASRKAYLRQMQAAVLRAAGRAATSMPEPGALTSAGSAVSRRARSMESWVSASCGKRDMTPLARGPGSARCT